MLDFAKKNQLRQDIVYIRTALITNSRIKLAHIIYKWNPTNHKNVTIKLVAIMVDGEW